jgi:ElaB/YqjD/DUF883 family membrane-anchored ribosome-binding protein
MASQVTTSRATIDQPTTERVTDRTKETLGQVADTAKRQADNQRERLARGIEQVAGSLRQTGDALNEHDQSLAGEYAQKTAGQVERVAGYLREHSVDEMVGDVQDFARREPALVLGGAFALGFLAARFLKAGGPKAGRQLDYRSTQYGPRYGAGRVNNGG